MPATQEAKKDPVIVVLQLTGGNDYVNTVIPYNNPLYRDNRKAVGLPELLRHLRGEIVLTDAIAAAQRATRRYAKRQTTWFRHQTAPDLRLDEPLSGSLLRSSRRFVHECVLTG